MAKTKAERQKIRADKKAEKTKAAENNVNPNNNNNNTSFSKSGGDDDIDIVVNVYTEQEPQKSKDENTQQEQQVKYGLAELLNKLPHFGVDEFINDKTIWQKQLYNVAGEPGWFYFKIFFDFKKKHGLLAKALNYDKSQGGIVDLNTFLAEKNTKNESQTESTKTEVDKTETTTNNNSTTTSAKPDDKGKTPMQELYDFLFDGNSAIGYLYSIKDKYMFENIPSRILSLQKFVTALKTIQTETPWIFKSINGLDSVNSANFNELGKPREIEIVFNTETADMRVGTLLDLYKYACYDAIGQKEILPANLRKFDMYIMTYEIPLYNFDSQITAMNLGAANFLDGAKIEASKTYPTGSGDFTNMMSFKLYSFKNCEIKSEELGMYTPSQISNETAVQYGQNALKIAYDRLYESRMNEWGQFFMSDIGGFLYDETSGINKTNEINIHNYRIEQIREGISTEYSQDAITNLYERINDFGNIYQNNKQFSIF